MATTRFSHLDDFTQDGQRVGIGTSTPTEALEVIGGSRSKNIEVTGIATLTSYEGFQNKKTSYVDNIHVDSGESGTLSGEVVIGAGLSMSVGTGATTGQGSIKSLKVGNTFTPPCGRTNDRPAASKPGALFYNKDFKTIEYWDGNFWRQVDNISTAGRAVFVGGSPATTAGLSIESVFISSLGNATDFATLNVKFNQGGGCSNKTRGLIAGGENPSIHNAISYWNMQGGGTAIDFGNLTGNRRRTQENGCSSSTRGMWFGGYDNSNTLNTIDYVEISTLGDAIDFGDINVGTRESGAALSSSVRAVFAGGRNQPANLALDDIVFTNISSKGNTETFGNLTRLLFSQSGSANSVRGIFAGGGLPGGTYTDEIIYITMASEGNATDFGKLSVGSQYLAATANQTRSLIAGGNTSPAKLNTIEYITIASTGNSLDFGDLSIARQEFSACSDSHGGLGGY